jgi:hypothetical protein
VVVVVAQAGVVIGDGASLLVDYMWHEPKTDLGMAAFGNFSRNGLARLLGPTRNRGGDLVSLAIGRVLRLPPSMRCDVGGLLVEVRCRRHCQLSARKLSIEPVARP